MYRDRNLYLPEHFLMPCQVSEWNGGTYRNVAALAHARYVDLVKCNAQIKRAKMYQDELKAKESKSAK